MIELNIAILAAAAIAAAGMLSLWARKGRRHQTVHIPVRTDEQPRPRPIRVRTRSGRPGGQGG